MTGGEEVIIERVRVQKSGICIEGEFELPPFAGLKWEDQVFVAAFVKCHGSIKRMEKMFGISYPTVKNRLNRIGDAMDFISVEAAPAADNVLDMLADGEINVDEALKRLRT